MNCVILFRINGGSVQGVTFDDGELHEFPHRDEAIRFADASGPHPSPFAKLVESGQADYQIVELDEL
jgi:hypothetical protein